MKENLWKQTRNAVLSIALCLSLVCGMAGCATDKDNASANKKETWPSAETVKAEEKKLLTQTKTYREGQLDRTYELQYDDARRLTGAVLTIFFEDHKDEVNFTFRYDSEGRLLEADRDDFWWEFANEGYEYDEQGRLVCYKYYWGGGELPYRQTNYQYDAQGKLVGAAELVPNDEQTDMETVEILAYTYLYDEQGRVSERHGRVTWIDGDFNMVTEYGEYPYSEHIDVVRYKYDAEGRVLAIYEASIPQVCVNSQGNQHLLQEDEIVTKYIYDYEPFALEQSRDGACAIIICDSVGTVVWRLHLGSDKLITDEDGYIIGSSALEYGYGDELIYGE